MREILEKDSSQDVQHQCELAIDQIEKGSGATDNLLKAYLNLNENSFDEVSAGEIARDFSLEDTDGNIWRLSDFKGKKNVVLIWVFADWCPVCHGEFHDLIEMQDEFKNQDTEVVTIEIHDTYRGRVMVGRELEPDYWFAEKSFQDTYTSQIQWRHLLDRAGSVGAMYGTDPMAFAVHAEYINRPATFIIDKKGKVRFSYIGTYWGDRPTIEETLEMIKTENYSFKHPQRLRHSVN
ncbi:peroxiredoxin [Marinilabilia salmonicolor]|uniref:Peroxiredoxin n=1 Tax=Marinilabilia salmonicolor TaxID=989 RepID=A0A368VB35_9BACT|nr:TlpA disulfide reductase family protein [Marinilabilia salmonicolor]RCW38322.1 peroxiredoxin [Marinilabilia salmonicolor]